MKILRWYVGCVSILCLFFFAYYLIDGASMAAGGNDTNNVRFPNKIKHKVQISRPARNGEKVGEGMVIEGTASIPAGEYLWVLAHIKHPRFEEDWWPQGEARVNPSTGSWKQWVSFGQKRDIGSEFVITVISVMEPEHRKLDSWVKKAKRTKNWDFPMNVPKTTSPPVFRTVTKTTH